MRRFSGCIAFALLAAAMLVGPAVSSTAWADVAAGVEENFGFPEQRVTGAPGSYALLLGADGGVLAGAYWIDREAAFLFDRPEALLGPRLNDRLLVDRAFLPTRVVVPARRLSLMLAYDRLPAAPQSSDGGDAVAMTVAPTAAGFVDPPRADPPFSMTFRWTGRADRTLGDTPVAAYIYEADGLLLPGTAAAAEHSVSRVYLPALGLDVTDAAWGDATGVLIGTGAAMSSSDLALTAWLARDLAPAIRACIVALRETPDYAAFDAAMLALEQRNVPLLPRGGDDILVYGAADYVELEERFRIMAGFVDCLAPPG